MEIPSPESVLDETGEKDQTRQTTDKGGEMTDIKMPIFFHANYKVIIRTKDWETRERAQKLSIRELSPEEQTASFKDLAEKDMPTHQIVFYDFGCKRVIEGKLLENVEEKIIFKVQEKEYEFSHLRPPTAQG
jgi:carbamoylphosphate synthase small subunit